MKLYIDVRLASDADAMVHRVKITGATEQEVFGKLAAAIESAVRRYARDVEVEREYEHGIITR